MKRTANTAICTTLQIYMLALRSPGRHLFRAKLAVILCKQYLSIKFVQFYFNFSTEYRRV